MKNGKLLRPNPLLSFTVSPSEYKKLKEIAGERGVTIAQVGRGLFRKAIKDGSNSYANGDPFDLLNSLDEVVRLGAF